MLELGSGPYVLALEGGGAPNAFPWMLPALRQLDRLDLRTPVTLLTGDNGTGKSTIVELLAEVMGFADEGGELVRAGELPPVARPTRDGSVAPVLGGRKPRDGYFLRAESFFGVAESVDAGGRLAPDLSLYGGVPLHEQSHGQSFLALAANRFGADGLYLLDEPEAALSVTGALALCAIIVRAARSGAQFVIATHSPVLLAIPDARIYELSADGVAPVAYDDIEGIRTLRAFLAAPERFVAAALEP